MYTAPELKALKASFIVHATEDESKVANAVGKALGLREFKVASIRGHYGNPIRYYEGTVKGKEASKAFGSILSALSERELEELVENYERCSKGGHLYLRLDKQGLVSGRIGFGGEDAVRIEAIFRSRGALRRWIEDVRRLQG